MFSFSVNREVDFTNIDIIPKTELGREWMSEMYIKALNGAVTAGNVDAYAFGCALNVEKNKVKREVPLITADELSAGYKGQLVDSFSADKASYEDAHRLTFAVDDFEEDSSYANALAQLEDIRPVIFNELHIDIANTLMCGLSTLNGSVASLKNLIAKYEKLGDVIKTILAHADSRFDIQRIASMPVSLDINA